MDGAFEGLGDDVNFLFGFCEALLADFDEVSAFFVMGDEIFEREVAFFHGVDDIFKASEGLLDGDGLGVGWGGVLCRRGGFGHRIGLVSAAVCFFLERGKGLGVS